jgi:CHAD domain-containing protein
MPKSKPIAWDAAATAGENAAAHLPGLARRYFRNGRTSLLRRPSPSTLHRFRLETKRFRYTLELFRLCYGPGLDLRLEKLREIQVHLGEISDCSATIELLGRADRPFAALLKRRMAAKTGALHSYWQETFDAAGQETWWTQYLTRFVRKQVSNEHR